MACSTRVPAFLMIRLLSEIWMLTQPSAMAPSGRLSPLLVPFAGA